MALVARCPRGSPRGPSSGRSCHGVSRSMPWPRRPPRRAAGGTSTPPASRAASAPSEIERVGSGTTSSGIDDPLEAEPVAALAGAVGRVEREDPRLDLRHRRAALEAGEALGEDSSGLAALAGARPRDVLRAGSLDIRGSSRRVDELDLDQPLGQPRRRLDRLGEPLAQPLLHHQPVDDDRDVVLELLVEHDLLVEPAQLAVDHGAGVALRRASPRAASRTRPCARGRPAPGP